MKIKKIINEVFYGIKKIYNDNVDSYLLNKSSKNINVFDLYDNVHDNATPIFFLSTGRCGTAWITSLLEKSKGVNVYHNPKPELIYHSRKNYMKELSNSSEVVDGARYEYIRNSYLLNRKYIETNNRITFFAYELAELYPEAKFVHLIRNPYNFIKSGLPRGWYSGKHLHDESRIFSDDNNLWNIFSIEEKIAWLWTETNKYIMDFGNSISDDRFFLIRTEDMFANIDAIVRLLKFLQITDISVKLLKVNVHHKVNSSKRKKILKLSNFILDDKKWYTMNTLIKKYGYEKLR